MTSIKKNFTYNVIYQILILIIPLITTPYISRVIGAEGTGIYSYTSSIVQYFALFAMLGINNYGNRTVAKKRDNKQELSKTFFSIYSMQFITTLIMIVIYIGYIFLFDNQYLSIAMLQILYMVSTALDINWFFWGLEKFKITVTRNAVIKILSTIMIFTFVKEQSDLNIYILIMLVSGVISQLALWPFLKGEINFVKIKWSDIKVHIKPNLILFVPVIAVSIYKTMDKIMLGKMCNMAEVGFYEYAERIQNIPLSMITALGTVMLPRMSNLISKGEKEKSTHYINKSIQFMLFASIPIVLGIIAVSKEIVPLFLGNEYVKTAEILQYLTITIIFVSWANVIRTQYLIPQEKDKIFIISVIMGAVINFVLNLILIGRYQAIGATISTVIAEFIVMMYQIVKTKNELEIKKHVRYFLEFFIKGIIMFVIVIIVKKVMEETLISILVQILVGIAVYAILNYKYILQILNKGKGKNDGKIKNW